MIPLGGLSMIVSLAIVIGVRMSHFARTRLWSLSIISVITMIVGTGVFAMSKSALQGNSNLDLYQKLTEKCEIWDISHRPSKIVLRVDGIGAGNSEADIKVLEALRFRRLKATIGAVPVGLLDNAEITRFIKKNGCNYEIAQYGWNGYSDTSGGAEFEALIQADAELTFQRGRAVISRVIGTEPTTFIAPGGRYSYGTRQAAIDIGFTVISGEGKDPLDRTVDISANNAVVSCAEAVRKNGICVIKIEPENYTTKGLFDADKFAALAPILDALPSLGAEFTTLDQLSVWYRLEP